MTVEYEGRMRDDVTHTHRERGSVWLCHACRECGCLCAVAMLVVS